MSKIFIQVITNFILYSELVLLMLQRKFCQKKIIIRNLKYSHSYSKYPYACNKIPENLFNKIIYSLLFEDTWGKYFSC